MMRRYNLPSVRNEIIPVREKIRELYKEMVDGDITTFVFDRAEDPSPYRSLIEETGLEFQELRPGELVFKKPGRAERWEYAFPIAKINVNEFSKEWVCADIGCGRKPWPRANHVVDTNSTFEQHKREGQIFTRGSITERLPFNDKQFDFVTCFHVLEHVNDPVAAAKELSRIGKRGLVEVPHPAKEGMLLFHETDHRWFVLPGKDRLLFHRIDNDWWKKMQDPEAQGAVARKYIYNKDIVGDDAILRNYFTRLEAYTNVIFPWEGELKVEIIE